VTARSYCVDGTLERTVSLTDLDRQSFETAYLEAVGRSTLQ